MLKVFFMLICAKAEPNIMESDFQCVVLFLKKAYTSMRVDVCGTSNCNPKFVVHDYAGHVH